MNVALPALVVFVLLLPGLIARARVKRVEKQSLDYSPFGQLVTEAVVWAGGLHAVWIGAITALGMPLRADVALGLLSADAKLQREALLVLAAQLPAVAAYFGSLLAFAYLAPLSVRTLITRHRLDRSGAPLANVFRFSGAPWYYLLSGADFAEGDTPDFIAVSAIVDVAGTPHLYTGVLTDYYLDADGQLDRLILQDVVRRPFPAATPAPTDDDFAPVPGDHFVLRYSEAITLNVEYVQVEDLTEAA